ncbi:MAG: hypothetical protein ACJAS1_004625, partial [Oleiphilaceae bacterium]
MSQRRAGSSLEFCRMKEPGIKRCSVYLNEILE